MHALEGLRECQLIDLVLEGNPAKDRARDEATYVRYPHSNGSPSVRDGGRDEAMKKIQLCSDIGVDGG